MIFAGSLAGSVAAVPGLPPAPERRRHGGRDPFPDAVRACHARGIRVHAWFPTLQFDLAPRDRHDAFEAAGRLLHRAEGDAIEWLDPAVEANLAELSEALAWIAAHEGVDGLCLDYVRYPDFATREAHDPAALETLLRRARAAVRAAAPACGFRAAVFGGAVAGHGVVGQNWGAWLELLEQLRAAWRAGCAGCAVYPFDRRFTDELLPVLKAAK